MINSFLCLKNKKEKEGQPDYRLTANFGTKEKPEYKDVGVGWKKTSEKGEFISFQLSKPYKEKKGFELTETELTGNEMDNI